MKGGDKVQKLQGGTKRTFAELQSHMLPAILTKDCKGRWHNHSRPLTEGTEVKWLTDYTNPYQCGQQIELHDYALIEVDGLSFWKVPWHAVRVLVADVQASREVLLSRHLVGTC